MEIIDLDDLKKQLAKSTAMPHGICRHCLGDSTVTIPLPQLGVIMAYCLHYKTGGVFSITANFWRMYNPFELQQWAELVADTIASGKEPDAEFAR